MMEAAELSYLSAPKVIAALLVEVIDAQMVSVPKILLIAHNLMAARPLLALNAHSLETVPTIRQPVIQSITSPSFLIIVLPIILIFAQAVTVLQVVQTVQ